MFFIGLVYPVFYCCSPFVQYYGSLGKTIDIGYAVKIVLCLAKSDGRTDKGDATRFDDPLQMNWVSALQKK